MAVVTSSGVDCDIVPYEPVPGSEKLNNANATSSVTPATMSNVAMIYTTTSQRVARLARSWAAKKFTVRLGS